jgi:CRISPR/Cas system CSM-associated protein Csm2 small subunit
MTEWFERLPENEKKFYFHLNTIIRNQALLGDFFERFTDECDNIIKIIAIEDKSDLVIKLKAVNKELLDATKIEKMAELDSIFHLELFKATGNRKKIEDWENKIKEKRGLPFRIWQTIGRNPIHHSKLCEIHSAILNAIDQKNEEDALDAMRQHFAMVLLHCAKKYKASHSSKESTVPSSVPSRKAKRPSTIPD